MLVVSSNNVNLMTMEVVNYEKSGGPDVLHIKELPKPTVNYSGEMMIQVAAAGLSVYEYNWLPLFPRYECSGKVTAVGSDNCKFKVGDEVCVILDVGVAHAEFVVVTDEDALRTPSRVSLVEAAALPEASLLTIFALSKVKNVTLGKTILIHGTAGGFDFIAIQYVKHIGCKVFAVAGTEEKLRICKLLGAEVCINYEKEDFCTRVKAETGERGVDIILDVSGRNHFQKNMDCLAIGGSLIISGQKVGNRVDIDLSFLMKKDISIIGVDSGNLGYFERSQLRYELETKFWPLIEDGHIKPIIGKIFTFAEVAEAYRALKEGSIPGKLLLVPQ